MNWTAIGILTAIVAFVIARIWVRRWIVRKWLADELTDRQAGALLLVTQLSPMLLFAGLVVISSPDSIPFVLLVVVLIAPIWIATWGALFTYMVTHGVKEQMRKDRQAKVPTASPD
jgi:hypothetical protein